jgi:hypothetical protein
MQTPSRNALAGGCLIPLSIAGGLIWGASARQLSLGLLAGLGLGLALALLVWIFDRR